MIKAKTSRIAELKRGITLCKKRKAEMQKYLTRLDKDHKKGIITKERHSRLKKEFLGNKNTTEWQEGYDSQIRKYQKLLRSYKPTVNPQIAMLLIVFALLINLPGLLNLTVTGQVTLETSKEYVDVLNITSETSINITWSPEHDGELERAGLTGRFIGDGRASIYLVSEEGRYLIIDSETILKEDGLSAITGLVTEEIPEIIEEINISINETNETEINDTEINDTEINDTEINESGNETGKTITPSLQYNSGTDWDVNDDGLESTKGVIDFSVEHTLFSWEADESKLCTRWEIESIETGEVNSICYGSEDCCAFVDLETQPREWNDDFYLYFERYGATENNKVSAQVMHIDYSTDTENPYSEIYYSETQELSAEFSAELAMKKINFTNYCTETCRIFLNESEYTIEIISDNLTVELEQISYTIEEFEEDLPPVAIMPIDVNVTVSTNKTIDLSEYFSDEYLENLTYEITAVQNISIDVTDSTLFISPEHNFTGARNITVTATDVYGQAGFNNGTITVMKFVHEENITKNITVNKTGDAVQGFAEIGKSVKWKKTIEVKEGEKEIEVDLPKEAISASAKKVVDDQEIEIEENKIKIKDGDKEKTLKKFEEEQKEKEKKDKIYKLKQWKLEVTPETKLIIEEEIRLLEEDADVTDVVFETTQENTEEIAVQGSAEIGTAVEWTETVMIIEETETAVIVEYETPAPLAIEDQLTDFKKQVTVSSDIPYENVLTYTSIKETPAQAIKVFWHVPESEYYLLKGIEPEAQETAPVEETDTAPESFGLITGMGVLEEEITPSVSEKIYRIDISEIPEMMLTLIDANNDENIDKVQWITPHLSNQTFDIEIQVINVQSYPMVGGNWTVEFNTTGMSDLTITPYNETTYDELPNRNPAIIDDLVFTKLECGQEDLIDNIFIIANDTKAECENNTLRFDGELLNISCYTDTDIFVKYSELVNEEISLRPKSVFVSDYECDSISYLTDMVYTVGAHHIRFQFGNSTSYAHNWAEQRNTSKTINATVGINSPSNLSWITGAVMAIDVDSYDGKWHNTTWTYSYTKNASEEGNWLLNSWIYQNDSERTDENDTNNSYYENAGWQTVTTYNINWDADKTDCDTYLGEVCNSTSCFNDGSFNIPFPNSGSNYNADCCGDDSSEYYNLSRYDSTLDGSVYNNTYGVCCIIASSCAHNGVCYNTTTTEIDVDSDGDNDYCVGNLWKDCNDNDGCAAGAVCSSGDCVNDADVELLAPLNNWIVNSTVQFECNSTSEVALANVTLWLNNSGSFIANISTATSGTSAVARLNLTKLPEKSIIWNCRWCDTLNNCQFALSNYTLTFDTTDPAISYVDPTPADNIRKRSGENFAYINVTSSDAYNNLSTLLDWSSSLVGWWRLEENYLDSSTYGNDGSCTACPRVTTGMRGKAYEFDGSDDYVTIPTSTVDISNDFSVSAWIYKTTKSGSDNDRILSLVDDADNGFQLIFDDATSKYAVLLERDGANVINQLTYGSWDTKSWIHLVYTISGSTGKFYRNGVLIASDGSTSVGTGDTTAYDIGRRGDNVASGFFKGIIDEVQIDTRALSGQEINASYSAGVHRLYNNFTGLASGNYTYKAHTIDQAGNTVSESLRKLSINNIPTHTTPSITASPYTTTNITCLNQTTADVDNDVITNTYNWLLNGSSIAVLNMPFDVNVSGTANPWVRDYSSKGNNGTLGGGTAANMPTWTTSGQVGGAYDFDGINDYINVPFTEDMTTGSIEMWIKSKNYPGTTEIFLEGDGSAAGSSPSLEGTATSMTFYVNNSCSRNAAYSKGEWTHFVGVWNGSQNILYKNGVVAASGACTSSELGLSKFVIGSRSGGNPGNATIDNVKIYNRSLNSEQIYQLYYESKDGYSSSSTIVSNETVQTEEWTCEVTPNDYWDFGAMSSDATTVLGSTPIITLDYPTNNSNTETNRTPTFNWTATDYDEDPMTFRIWVDNNSDFSSPEIDGTSTGSTKEHTPTTDLEVDMTYWWKVEVTSGSDAVNATVFNFSLPSVQSVDLITSDINFSDILNGESNDTANNSPPPFVIRNTGNVFVNVTIKSTALWTSALAPLNSAYFQFKVDNVTGKEGSYDSDSQILWTNMDSNEKAILNNFNYSSATSDAEIDINLTAASDEPSGERTSTITVTIS